MSSDNVDRDALLEQDGTTRHPNLLARTPSLPTEGIDAMRLEGNEQAPAANRDLAVSPPLEENETSTTLHTPYEDFRAQITSEVTLPDLEPPDQSDDPRSTPIKRDLLDKAKIPGSDGRPVASGTSSEYDTIKSRDHEPQDAAAPFSPIHAQETPNPDPVALPGSALDDPNPTVVDQAMQCAKRMAIDFAKLKPYISKGGKADPLHDSILMSLLSMQNILGENSSKSFHKRQTIDPKGVDVLYRVRFMETGKSDVYLYQDIPFPGIDLQQKDPVDLEDDVSILDVIIDVSVTGQALRPLPKSEIRNNWHHNGRKQDIAFGKDLQVVKQKQPAIKIYSKILTDALGNLIPYYPDLASNFNHIPHPYKVLLLHLPKIVAYRATCKDKTVTLSNVSTIPDDQIELLECVRFEAGKADSQSLEVSPEVKINWKDLSAEDKILEVLDWDTSLMDFQTKRKWKDSGSYFQEKLNMQQCDTKLAHHIDVLLTQVIERYRDEIVPELDCHMQNIASYDRLWVLFKPGIDVFATVEGQLAAFVVLSCETREPKHDPKTLEDETGVVIVTAWNLTYTGSKLVRNARTFIIPGFDGTKEISSLPVYPTWCHAAADNERQKLTKRGQGYCELIRVNPPAHRLYDGKTMEEAEKYFKPYKGEIIVDPQGYLQHHAQKEAIKGNDEKVERRFTYLFDESLALGVVESRARQMGDKAFHGFTLPTDRGGGPLWQDFNEIDPARTGELTDHHYLLLPRHILGFALKIKEWRIFDVKKIKPLESPSQSMGNLILPAGKKYDHMLKMILADSESGQSDFVEEKGKAKVVLLHGGPGTGKTFTVECLSKAYKRPLLALTVADLGNQEDEMEERLSNWFRLAESWKAIMLIDEADVFLEARKPGDLNRNCLIAAFLRTMEYYSGILFLTSNRAGQIDTAFSSRILLALHYKSMGSTDRRRLWESLVKLNVKASGGKIVFSVDAQEYLVGRECSKIKLNGRDIRNTIQAAILYAQQAKCESENSNTSLKVDEEHIVRVLRQHLSFLDYQTKIFGMSLEQRALADLSRYEDSDEDDT